MLATFDHPTQVAQPENLINFTLDKALHLTFQADTIVVIALVIIATVILLSRFIGSPWHFWKSFEINEAEFGFGNQKVKISPNVVDQQIAYKIWVELSTRKIGIPIDTKNDVIYEIYESWFNFFSVTRELIKDVPVQKFRRKDTEQIVRLSIDVLNQGI